MCQPHFDSAQITAVPNFVVPRILLPCSDSFIMTCIIPELVSAYEREGLEGLLFDHSSSYPQCWGEGVCMDMCILCFMSFSSWLAFLIFLADSFFSVYTLYLFCTYFAYLIVTLIILAKNITVYKNICPHELSDSFYRMLFFSLQMPRSCCIPGTQDVCFEFKKKRVYLGNTLLSFRCFS